MSFKKCILVGAGFLVILIAAFLFIKPTPPLPTKLPNPNGYDDLIKAGQLIVGRPPDCDGNPDGCIEQLREFCSKNAQALQIARIGLRRESRVPTKVSWNSGSGYINNLTRAMLSEAELAQKENRIGDAIETCLALAHMNQKLRGAGMIDAMLGLTAEGAGLETLQKMSDKFSVAQRQEVLKTLIEIYSDRDSIEDVLKNDKRNRPPLTLRDRLTLLLSYFSTKQVEQKLALRMTYKKARIGLFQIQIGLENFRSENGNFPKVLEDLIPVYLPALPKDDFSGTNFIYRPGINACELYGFGYDGRDDGGKPLSDRTTEAAGDMLTTSRF